MITIIGTVNQQLKWDAATTCNLHMGMIRGTGIYTHVWLQAACAWVHTPTSVRYNYTYAYVACVLLSIMKMYNVPYFNRHIVALHEYSTCFCRPALSCCHWWVGWWVTVLHTYLQFHSLPHGHAELSLDKMHSFCNNAVHNHSFTTCMSFLSFITKFNIN